MFLCGFFMSFLLNVGSIWGSFLAPGSSQNPTKIRTFPKPRICMDSGPPGIGFGSHLGAPGALLGAFGTLLEPFWDLSSDISVSILGPDTRRYAPIRQYTHDTSRYARYVPIRPYTPIRPDTPAMRRYAPIRSDMPDTPATRRYAQIRPGTPDTCRYADTPRYAQIRQIHADMHRYARYTPIRPVLC